MAFIKYTSGIVQIVKENISCTCGSDEHQINFRYFEEEDLKDLVYVTIHLKPERNIFKRFLKAFKYFFGYRSKFGDFDEVILDEENCKRIASFLEMRFK